MLTKRIGIDLAISGAHTAMIAQGVELLGRPFRFRTTQEGIAELLERAGTGPVEFVMEPTGHAWTVLSACLVNEGHRVRLVKTQKSSDLRKFFERHCKTDSVDAGVIARLPAIDPKGAPTFEPLPSAVGQLRRIIKQRQRFVEQATAHKLRLHALMQLAHPHLLAALGRDKFGVAGKLMIGPMSNALDIVPRGRRAFDKRLQRASRGHLSAKRLQSLWEAYQATYALYKPLADAGRLPFDPRAIRAEGQRDLDGLAFADKQVAELDAEIETLYLSIDPDETLRQIPGLGPLLAPTVEALSHPISRFRNVRGFAAYCGVVPRRHQTGKGKHDTPGRPMTKAGPRLLKRALRLAADVARRIDPEFADIYARRSAAGKPHEKTLGLLAHKLARRVFAVLRRRDEAARRGVKTNPYVLRLPNGENIDNDAARSYVSEHYPSKSRRAETARAGGAEPSASPAGLGPPSEDDAARRGNTTVNNAASDASLSAPAVRGNAPRNTGPQGRERGPAKRRRPKALAPKKGLEHT